MPEPLTDLLRRPEFWLIVVSVAVLLAERIRPWRVQKLLRPYWTHDLFWFTFNGFALVWVFGWLLSSISQQETRLFQAAAGVPPTSYHLVADLPIWLQVIVAMLIIDFTEWVVHNILHRVPFLWRIHRVHHSIHIMDFVGNFRFHWGEIIVYRAFKVLPVALLGAHWLTLTIVSVITLTIGHLNHSNLNITWGPFRYILNSPRMHIWHHDSELHGTAGANFAVVFSLWDWLFRTAYWPEEPIQPAAIGFAGDEKLPESLLWRFFIPFLDHQPPPPRLPTD